MFFTGTAPLDLGVSQEVQDYYSNIFGGKVTIVLPGSNPWDVLDNYGKVIFEKNGLVKEVQMSDVIVLAGYDGYDDLVREVTNNWPKDDNPEYTERKLYWQAYFGV